MIKNLFVSLFAFSLLACGNAQTTSETATETTTETAVVQQKPAVQNLTQGDLAGKIMEENVVLIDVRTPGEIAQGYIKGAQKFIDINGASFESEIQALDKSKTYVMYCRSGGRSGRAADYMVNNGFTNVYNLLGGISNYSGEVVK
jgi:rhodanese-related sulfurtransferase